MDKKAFSYRPLKRVDTLFTGCAVSKAYMPGTDPRSVETKPFQALWDTGATHSVIDSSVAKALNLTPIGYTKTYHANGEAIVAQYLVNIILPNGIIVHTLPVTEGILNDFGVLIGMDIITLGDFAITNKNGQTLFSFQIPSTHEYDFVKQIEHEREEDAKKRNKKKR